MTGMKLTINTCAMNAVTSMQRYTSSLIVATHF
jgi:hypothetical protein